MRLKAIAAASVAATLLAAGASRAAIIEDIYTGSVNFGPESYTAVFEYDDQVGSDSATDVRTGAEDPTILANITFSDGTFENLQIGAGDSSEYYVIPGYSISSDFVSANGDFLQIGGLSSLAPDNLSTAFSDGGRGSSTGTGQIDGAFYILAPSSVQVIVNPSAVSAAPEPATWALMIAGIGGMGLALRRVRRSGGLGKAVA